MALKIAGANLCLQSGLLGASRDFSLHSADPGNDGSSELAGGAYARVALAEGAWTHNANSGIASNTAEAAFPAPTAAWDDPIWSGMWNAGSLLWTDALEVDIMAPQIGAAVSWGAGELTVGLDTTGTITTEGMKACLQTGLLSRTGYLGIFTDDPGGDGSNEIDGTGYARVQVMPAQWAVNMATGIATNNVGLSFPTPAIAWDDVTWVALMDALNGGNVLWRRALTNDPDAPPLGSTVRFAPSSIEIQLTTDN